MASYRPHPFDPIRPDEIQRTVKILQLSFPGVSLRFKAIEIQEPRKAEVVPFLEAERLGKPLPPPPARTAYVLFHRLDNHAFIKGLVNLDTGRPASLKELPKEVQGPVDVDEMIEIEELCLKHPEVIKEIEKMKLPKGVTVCNDPWAYSTDDINETRRLFQCYMYIVAIDHPQTNHYSLPAHFSPVFDAHTKELIRIDHLALGDDHSTHDTQPWKPIPAIEYAHDLLQEPLRQDLKPYIVQQPQGPSYSVEGHLVKWQKWRFRVGWNYRDGVVLYNMTYDGRNIFHRLSLSEMTVPYADPRRPYHRKQAFDVGDVGLGITCNQLNLGCDCLGHIKYFDGFRTNSKGQPIHLKNVVCLHEQDAGILHKHTNYRNGEATVVRNRQLVVQMICTVSNYEYIFAWVLDQTGGVELEARATGILSTSPIGEGETVPWAIKVGEGVVAPYHQHVFSLRIDPAIDGHDNTVFYEDTVRFGPGSRYEDPFGVAYTTQSTVLDKAGFAECDVSKSRVFKIRNDNVINKISGKPVAYKIQTLPSQRMLADPESFNFRRAQFAAHDIWVTKYQDDELYAAGEMTNQSRESSGVEKWAARKDNTNNADVVVWHTFCLTHNPRTEDFPVMPMEKFSVHLKPSSFFEKNPALDVPPSVQAVNKSTLHPGSDGKCCEPKL